MGHVAAAEVDFTIITDDNPYGEDRSGIGEEISAGLRDAGKREGHDFALVPDRRQAIAQALAMAVDEDVVLLAGKGHEGEVFLADSSYACGDREVATRVLRELLAGTLGPHLPIFLSSSLLDVKGILPQYSFYRSRNWMR